MAEKGRLPAIVALWIPNVVFASLGIALFVAVARERSLTLAGMWSRWRSWLQSTNEASTVA
jgi:hypothetical protein